MMRRILSILAGLAVTVVCVGLLEALGHLVFPPPEGMDVSDPETLKTVMWDIPLGAKLSVLAAWTLGTFAGGAVAAYFARAGSWPAWTIAGIMLLLIGINLVWIPHPVWMIVAAILLTVIAGYAASRVAGART